MAEKICTEHLRNFSRKKLDEAIKLLEDAVENLPKEVENCNTFRLTFWLGDAGNAYGMAVTVMELVPDAETDPEFKSKWSKIADLYDKAWRQRDQFMLKCRPPGW
ncbi:MAG: hypothetical protein NZ932_03880 [Candidatus Bathyarchaeota archaeon]|nr:hypothetical protein [Candidatus Bathyarchaeota archaeon]MDW8022392.1 hypothetical protein [Nitrososphaerota archaeon]